MSTRSSTPALRLAVLALLPFFAAACRSGQAAPAGSMNHWSLESVPQRIVKQFTGYRSGIDGEYVDYQYKKKKHINRTLRRHFLNNDADSPFQPTDPSDTGRRPPHSMAPDPIYYFHVESVVIGAAMLGITGGFIPIPVDSVIATVDGGWDEFGEGFANTFTGGGGAEARNPVPTDEFKVKNR